MVRNPAWLGNAALALLSITSILAWHTALRQPDPRLRVTVLNVGQGDAVLIESPTGGRVLVDGGPTASTLSSLLGRRLPLFDRRLDWVVIAAPEDEHVAGLFGVLGQNTVGKVLVSGEPGRTGAYRDLLEAFSKAGTEVIPAETGQVLDLGDGITLRVVNAGKYGAILELNWDRASFLLPIGMDGATLEALLAQNRFPAAHGLLLPDHADMALYSDDFIWAVNPGLGVVSKSGESVLSPNVVNRLRDRTLLRTDVKGWVEWATDGRRVWVTTER